MTTHNTSNSTGTPFATGASSYYVEYYDRNGFRTEAIMDGAPAYWQLIRRVKAWEVHERILLSPGEYSYTLVCSGKEIVARRYIMQHRNVAKSPFDTVDFTKRIKLALFNKQYLPAAKLLADVYHYRLYISYGYISMNEYVQKEFHKSQTWGSICVKIGDCFLDETGQHTIFATGGDDFSIGQLTRMLRLSPDEIRALLLSGEIQFGMSLRAITKQVDAYLASR